jgi:hypothetical protein
VYATGTGGVKGELRGATEARYDFIATVYVPRATDRAAAFAPQTFKCLAKNMGAENIMPLGEIAPECVAFTRIGFDALVDVQANKFRKPLLPMLDAVLAAPAEISPLFRAYLHYQLLDLLKVRPQAWGAHWSPALLEHHTRLKDIGVAELGSKSWMVPSQVDEFAKKLADFYRDIGAVDYMKQARGQLAAGRGGKDDRLKPVSYMEQARGQLAVIQKAYEAGIAYAGFVAADGKPALCGGAQGDAEIWGLAADSDKLVRLYRFSKGQTAPVSDQRPQSFTPLFAWNADRKAVLREAAKAIGLAADDLASLPSLPPLLRD